jgi:hypothetical protein
MKINFSQREWIYPSLIVILGFCYYLSYINYGISVADEGFFVYGAERVLKGQLPMSDFISYPPGSYFLLAFLFKIFGTNLLVSRFVEMVFLVLNGVMVFYIAKRLMPRTIALIPSFVLIAFPGPWHKVFFAFGLLLPLIALLRFLEKRTTGRILTIGWATGVALILKLEPALYSFSAILIVLWCLHTWKRGKFLIEKKAITGFLKEGVLCSLGSIAVVTPVLLYYLWKSSVLKLYSTIVGIYGLNSVVETVKYLGKPSFIKAITKFHIGNLVNLFFFLVLLLYLYLSVKVFIQLFVRKEESMPPLLPILLFGIFSLHYACMVFERSHLLQSLAIAYIVFGYVMYTLLQKKGIKSKVAVVVLVILLGLFVVDSFKWKNHFYSGSISRLYAIEKEGAGEVSSPKGRVYLGKKESDALQGLINFFKGKKGYLLPLYYEPLVNFLTGLENPTRYSILFPSFFREKQLIDDVERFNIRYLLIPQILWTNEGSIKLGDYAPGLYEYVMQHYPFEREVGGYLVFSRQPL